MKLVNNKEISTCIESTYKLMFIHLTMKMENFLPLERRSIKEITPLTQCIKTFKSSNEKKNQ